MNYKEIKESIIDYIDDKVNYPIHDIIVGIKNIIYWIPVIYKDRDWDGSYLYKIIDTKLTRMHKKFLNGHLVHTKKDMRKLSIAIETMRRLRRYTYSDFLEAKMDEKWGEIQHGDDADGRFRLFRAKVKTDSDKRRSRSEFKRIMNHENIMVKQDLKFFGDSFKHSRKWWD